MQAVTVAMMQAVDDQAITAWGVPRLVLMDNAGLALARAVIAAGMPGAVVVCCGRGYNGGDGLAAAVHLARQGIAVQVVSLVASDALRVEPRAFAAVLAGLQVPEAQWPAESVRVESWLRSAAVVVDCLLGIGLRTAVREPERSLIGRINNSHAHVIAADVPSGLDADSGRVLGAAVRAHQTVTFGLAKQGCLQDEARSYVGQLAVDSIGFPPELLKMALSGRLAPHTEKA
jgi:NAD(P)H-hydrate epimerase